MESSSSQQNVTADHAIIVSAERFTVKKATHTQQSTHTQQWHLPQQATRTQMMLNRPQMSAIIVSADGTKMMLNRPKIIKEQECFYHRGKTYILKSAIARSDCRTRSKSAPGAPLIEEHLHGRATVDPYMGAPLTLTDR